MTMASVTAYRSVDYDVTIDNDISELDLTTSHVHEIQHQWSQETTIAQEGTRARWVAGLFFFDDVDRQPTSIFMGTQRVENRLDVRVDSNAAAGFGQATVGLTSRVSVTGGLRYTRERKSIENMARPYTISAQPVRLPGGFAYTDAISYAAWTPKVGMDVRLGTASLAYGSATRGFKSGGFNASSPEAGGATRRSWPGVTKAV